MTVYNVHNYNYIYELRFEFGNADTSKFLPPVGVQHFNVWSSGIVFCYDNKVDMFSTNI